MTPRRTEAQGRYIPFKAFREVVSAIGHGEPFSRRGAIKAGLEGFAALATTLAGVGLLEGCVKSEKGIHYTPEQFFAVAFRNGKDAAPDFSPDNGGFPAGEGIVIDGINATYEGKRDELIPGWGENVMHGTDRYTLINPSGGTVSIHDLYASIHGAIDPFDDALKPGTYKINVVLAVAQALTDTGAAVDQNGHPILQLNVKEASSNPY